MATAMPVKWSSALCVASTSTHTRMLVDDEVHRPSMRSHSTQPCYNDHPDRPIKSELTSSPDSRLSSLSPTLLPRPLSRPENHPKAAIQPFLTQLTHNSDSQHVSVPVNSRQAYYLTSPATSSDVYSHFLGPPVPSSSSKHVLTHRRQRLRTSNLVFSATHGSIIAPDIPKNLPPAPSTAPHRRPSDSEPEPFFDFESMKSNYINMLNQNVDAADTAVSDMQQTVSPADLQAPVAEELQDLVDILKQGISFELELLEVRDAHPTTSPGLHQPFPPTPDLYSSPDFNDFGDEFLTTSPDTDLLNTPVVGEDDILTGMFEDDPSGLLFPVIDYSSSIFAPPAPTLDKSPAAPFLDVRDLYTLTPESPMLPDFNPSINPSSIYPSPRLPTGSSALPPAPTTAPSTPGVAPVSMPTSATVPTRIVRKTSATGTRKGVTPQALVPIDAPTQPRKYATPSATSRKELPSVFAKKRSRSTAFGDEADDVLDLEPLGPNPTERELIEYKRRQNTVAARRSRKRKLEYQQHLEDRVRELQGECVRWRERVAICQEMLKSHGVAPPVFVDEEEA